MKGFRLKREFPNGGLCEGKNKQGNPCGTREVFRCRNGKLKCRFHGGTNQFKYRPCTSWWSTKPKTKLISRESLQRTLDALWAGRKRYWDDVKAGNRLPPAHNINTPERITSRIRQLQRHLGVKENEA